MFLHPAQKPATDSSEGSSRPLKMLQSSVTQILSAASVDVLVCPVQEKSGKCKAGTFQVWGEEAQVTPAFSLQAVCLCPRKAPAHSPVKTL